MHSFVFLNPETNSMHKHHCGALFSEQPLASYCRRQLQIPTASSPFVSNCEGSAGVSSGKMVLGRKPGPGPGLSSQHAFLLQDDSPVLLRVQCRITCFVPTSPVF